MNSSEGVPLVTLFLASYSRAVKKGEMSFPSKRLPQVDFETTKVFKQSQ